MLKYLLNKKNTKPRVIRWILLLQEFDLEIKDKKVIDNVVADHLPCIEKDKYGGIEEELLIDDAFLNKQLLAISKCNTSWYAYIVNYLVCEILSPNLNFH